MVNALKYSSYRSHVWAASLCDLFNLGTDNISREIGDSQRNSIIKF